MPNAARDKNGTCKSCGAGWKQLHEDDCLFHPKKDEPQPCGGCGYLVCQCPDKGRRHEVPDLRCGVCEGMDAPGLLHNHGAVNCSASRDSVLSEAARLVDGDRQTAYGHPRDNHACTAAMWDAYLDRRGVYPGAEGSQLDAVDVCVLNVLQKLSRFANTRQRDSIVDAAGFLANIEMILDGKWDS